MHTMTSSRLLPSALARVPLDTADATNALEVVERDGDEVRLAVAVGEGEREGGGEVSVVTFDIQVMPTLAQHRRQLLGAINLHAIRTTIARHVARNANGKVTTEQEVDEEGKGQRALGRGAVRRDNTHTLTHIASNMACNRHKCTIVRAHCAMC